MSASIATPALAQGEGVLAEVEAIVTATPINARLDPDATRRCFLAVDQVMNMEPAAQAARLAGFLQDVCYGGLTSELEREGLYRLLSEMNHELEAGSAVSDVSGLGEAIAACWNVGSLSREAYSVTVVVAFDATHDGRPMLDTIELVEFSDGSEGAAEQAYETVRRAIFQCGRNGFRQIRAPGRYELAFNAQEDPSVRAPSTGDE